MKDELLSYYNRELAYIRHLGAEFAKANPKVAEQLHMTAESVDDPHVARLIEAFAFLNARIRHKLDDDFPELSEALLSVLYPHYLAPIPSLSIVQLKANPNLQESFTVPRNTMLETAPVQGEPCRFRTCYDTSLLPLRVSEAELVNHRRHAPPVSNRLGVGAVLRVALQTLNDSITFSKLSSFNLRFFLRGPSQQMFALYDLIMNGTLKMALATGPDDDHPIFIDSKALRQVGLDLNENLLPYPARSFLGYRLLTEFFVFPEKFLFFELTALDLAKIPADTKNLNLYFYLKKSNKELEEYVNADNFALGCTPIVNLFKHRAEPITVTHTEPDYHIVTESQRPNAYEIYSINAVTAVYSDGKQKEFSPFYGIKHSQQQQQFWYVTRRPAAPREGEVDKGTELFISLVDLGFHPSSATNYALDIETLCCNRDLPNQLPFGGNQPYFQFSDFSAPVRKIECLVRPTPTYRSPTGNAIYWRLLSHLNLNKISLTDPKDGCEALREILRLYNFTDSNETRAIIESVLSTDTRSVLARDPSGNLSFCQGTEIILELDQDRFSGGSAFLFASILERFFALYCNINSFTKLTVVGKGKHRVIHEWQPRTGEQTLL